MATTPMQSMQGAEVGQRRPTTVARPRLIICDEAVKTRYAIIAILGQSYECVGVGSAEEALAAAATGIDLLLTEVALSEVDGIELCKRVRANPAYASTPIVLLTNIINDDTRALGYESGADDYLFKPIRPRELRARVTSLLKLRDASRTLEARTQELENANRFLSQAQSALLQAEKLASIGTLVAGVAHEINNPVAFIKSGAASILEYIEDVMTTLPALFSGTDEAKKAQARKEIGEALQESAQITKEISDGARRLQRICQDLKSIASEQKSDLEQVNVVEEINKAWKMAALRSEVTLEVSVNGAPPVVPVGHLVGQVAMNLFQNAAQAIVGPGTVWCTIDTTATCVSVVIRDSGPGIAEKHLTRIFDPFFTTKSPGQGTGLGLAVSQALIQKLGGSLTAKSPPGSGAIFTLEVPLRRDEYNSLRSGKVA